MSAPEHERGEDEVAEPEDQLPARERAVSGVKRRTPLAREGPDVQPPILVVDDDADTRELLGEILRSEGYAVLEANNGREALALLTDPGVAEPGLIVLDLNMPTMTGWELIAIVKGYHRLARIPILVISGGDPHRDALEHGAIAHCFRKPIERDDLLQQVTTILGNRRMSK